ncbi:MAG TPA: SH3 domain-containing protein [Thermodesulfobacteriota bacterium]|nr:SH3 domain-containing protein [Thermodesulfobacteriota bacterium]
MKIRIWIVFLLLGLMTSVALAAGVRVITQDGVIRKERRFFSSPVIRAPYGAVLEQTGKQGDWVRVNYRGKEGWIHKSAVQEQKFDFTTLAGGRADESSQDEIALAGKGFTPEVEKVFREKNPNVRYDLVNKIEAFKADEQRVQSFIQAGGLKEPGGGS